MDIYTLEAISQDTIKPQIPSPAQIVEANICTGNPVALCLFSQMAHHASMITQALTQDDASLTTNVNTATTATKLTAETK
jgi:N-acetylglucosamine kinase-like BadF-type ATPase